MWRGGGGVGEDCGQSESECLWESFTHSLTSLSSVGVSTVFSGGVYPVHHIGGALCERARGSRRLLTGDVRKAKSGKKEAQGDTSDQRHNHPNPKRKAFIANVNVNGDSSWCFFVCLFYPLSLSEDCPSTLNYSTYSSLFLYRSTPSGRACPNSCPSHCHSLPSTSFHKVRGLARKPSDFIASSAVSPLSRIQDFRVL